MSADFIIVGAGTAGCALAQSLAARGARVALIEAGGSHRHMHARIPAAFPKLFKSARDWAFETEPQAALGQRRIFWPRGKMLGGSSSMNAQIHQWCCSSDFEAWERAAGREWGPKAMAGALTAADTALNGGTLRDPHPMTHAFIDAAAQAGLAHVPAPHGGPLRAGAWISEVAHRNGARMSAADAFLPTLPRGAIIMQALVERVDFDGRRAVGVTFRRDGRTERLTAARGVILCAGAINTPHLLMLSGIGPASPLAAAGINVLHPSNEVGGNLMDHLMLVMHFRSRRQDTLRSAESPAQLFRYLTQRRGMLASNVAEAIAFAPSTPGGAIDLEIVFAPALFEKEGLAPPSEHGFSLAPVLLKPRSRGRVSLSSPRAEDAPRIDPAYLSDPDGSDLTRLMAGAWLAHSIAGNAPLAHENAGMILPKAMDEENIAAAIRQTAHTIYHPMGTCRLGSDDESVIDPSLRVRGTDGLWVADASITPTPLTGHPNAVIAAIGLGAGDLIWRDEGAR